MAIEVDSEIRFLNQEDFHALNRRVLGIIFDVHNEFGRFLEIAMLKDWGGVSGGLGLREAITYFLGGPTAVIKPVTVYSCKNLLGYQKMHLLNSETALAITEVIGDLTHMAKHQSR